MAATNLSRLLQVFLGQTQLFLPDEGGVLRRHKAALARHGLQKTISGQVFVGPLDGDDAQMQVPGQGAHGGQGLTGGEGAVHDLGFDLGADLFIQRLVAVVADEDLHKLTVLSVLGVLV